MVGAPWRPFSLNAIAPEPWRNGAGVTRTLASGGADASAPWHWRVSVATIEADGAFSTFPGVERSSLLMGGGQLTLTDAKGRTALCLGLHESGQYAGDTPLQAVVQGAPLLCLNAMALRTRARAQVRTVDSAAATARECVLLVLRGAFLATVRDSQASATLFPAQGLHAPPGVGLVLTPLQPNSLLALVEVDKVTY